MEHCCSVTVSYLVSHFSSLTVVHCKHIIITIKLLQPGDYLLLIDSIALLLVDGVIDGVALLLLEVLVNILHTRGRGESHFEF